jgi:hypothetical protein
MALPPKLVEERIETIKEAWNSLRKQKPFAGMTLAQFATAIQSSFDARAKIKDCENQLTAAPSEREAADAANNEIALLVVNAVKGDLTEGEDGELYAAMGYVRKRERKSGLKKPSSLKKAA